MTVYTVKFQIDTMYNKAKAAYYQILVKVQNLFELKLEKEQHMDMNQVDAIG
jgi:hypothetical protein